MVSPGDSSRPASIEPSITAEAPAASAFTMSPDWRTPPSAITGTPAGVQAATALSTAVSCGMPQPVTMRVVQMEPGPMPTLTPSAPASTRALAPSVVATLPATTGTFSSFLMAATVSITLRLWPCAVSTTTTSQPASTSLRTRSRSCTPTAAPQTRRPRTSRAALGNSSYSRMSFIVIIPARVPSAPTRISFSTLFFCRIARAWCSVVLGAAVTRSWEVITSRTVVSRWSTKRRSRCVRMPTTRRWPSTTGSPLILCAAIRSLARPTVSSGCTARGFMITPLALRLTLSTSSTCFSTVRFLWTMPMPPCWASATAMRHSVTVSIAALAMGIWRSTPRQKRLRVLTSRGRADAIWGTSNTSS